MLEEEEGGRKDYRLVVSAPAGKPPEKLEATDERSVRIWVFSCIRARPNEIFTANALVYWARYFFPYDSEEFAEVKYHIERIPQLQRNNP